MTLRPMRPADGRALGEILRDRQVARFLPLRVRNESGRQFVTRVLREQSEGNGAAWVILPLGSDEVVGQIRFVHWSRREASGEVGYWIRRRHWGRGFGTDALGAICRFGFRSMALHRIEARVVVGNDGSRRVLEKLGFRQEGILRGAARGSDGWADVWSFGLLRGDRSRSDSEPRPRRGRLRTLSASPEVGENALTELRISSGPEGTNPAPDPRNAPALPGRRAAIGKL